MLCYQLECETELPSLPGIPLSLYISKVESLQQGFAQSFEVFQVEDSA